jgi:hypothetical protein
VLGLHSLSEDGYVAGVDLSNEQFDALQATARAAGKSLSELLCKALENMVEPAVVISPKPPLDVCWHCARITEGWFGATGGNGVRSVACFNRRSGQ